MIEQLHMDSKFSKKFINKKMQPARPQDLNSYDFFLWGHLKSSVHNPLPKTLDALNANIERGIKNISKNEKKYDVFDLKLMSFTIIFDFL